MVLHACPAKSEEMSCPIDTGNPREMEDKGRTLFDEALRREAADPRGALELLSCAQRIADKPAVSLRVGLIAERLGNKRLAAESYERYLALAGDAAPDRVALGRHIEKLRSALAQAARVPRADPAPTPAPEPPAPERRSSPTLGYIGVAVGSVLMIGGVVFVASAKSKSDDVHAIEPGTTFWNTTEARGEFDAAKRQQTLGIVTVATGAVVTGLGVWLLLDDKRGVSATARVGPKSSAAALRVRF